MNPVDTLFSNLWQQYIANNPKVYQLHEALQKKETISNDHIALRTFADCALDLPHIANMLIELGFVTNGDYVFNEKKLTAQSFYLNDQTPLIFVSQLHWQQLSKACQGLIEPVIEAINQQAPFKLDQLWQGVSWPLISVEAYQQCSQESEYASWLLAHGFCANHFTVAVHKLAHLSELEAINAFVIEQGYPLNQAGGVIKGTKAKGLRQSSTLAESKLVQFANGQLSIPSCYYEFAQRYLVDGQLFLGFESANADKIFESTHQQR